MLVSLELLHVVGTGEEERRERKKTPLVQFQEDWKREREEKKAVEEASDQLEYFV